MPRRTHSETTRPLFRGDPQNYREIADQLHRAWWGIQQMRKQREEAERQRRLLTQISQQYR